MINLFKKKPSKEDIVSYMVRICIQISMSFKEQPREIKAMISSEIAIFLYTILDRILAATNHSKKEREYWYEAINQVFYEFCKELPQKISIEEVNKLYDSRIRYYCLIVEKVGSNVSAEYWKALLDYQIQLLASILLHSTFSDYNPVPEHFWEYSPIEIGLFITTNIRHALSDVYEQELPGFIKLIQAYC